MSSWLRFQRCAALGCLQGPVRCDQRVRKLIIVRGRTLFGGQRCSTSRETSISVCQWTSVGRVRYDKSSWLRFQRFLASGRPLGPSNVPPTCPQDNNCAGKDFIWGAKMCYKSRNVHFSVPMDLRIAIRGFPTNKMLWELSGLMHLARTYNHAMRKGQVHLRRCCVPFSQTDVTLPLRGSRYSLQLLVARSFF